MERMNSLSPECNELKHRYDDCFNAWFSEKFLKGSNDDECSPLLKLYQECVRKAMKEKNIDISEVERPILGTNEDQSIGKDAKKAS